MQTLRRLDSLWRGGQVGALACGRSSLLEFSPKYLSPAAAGSPHGKYQLYRFSTKVDPQQEARTPGQGAKEPVSEAVLQMRKAKSERMKALVGKSMEEVETEFDMKEGGGNIVENLEAMIQKGVHRKEIRKVVKARSVHVLARTSTATLGKKLDMMGRKLELTSDDLTKIIRIYPAVLSLSWEENVEPFLDVFLKRYSTQRVKKMVVRFPSILGFASRYEKLKQLLQEKIGCTDEEYLAVISRFPALLSTSIEGNTIPRIDQFFNKGLSKDEVKAMFSRAPPLFRMPFETAVEDKLTWLKEELWMSDEEGVQVLKEYPEVFVDSVDTWKDSLTFFLDLGWRRESMKTFFKEAPTALAHRVPLLQAKLRFAKEHLHKSDSDLYACPAYFVASLKKVIMFRVAFWLEFGENPRNLPLSSLLGGPNSKFNEKFNALEIKKFGLEFNKLSETERLRSITSRL